jgi:hypothetical protein
LSKGVLKMEINEHKDFPFELKSEDVQPSGIFKGYGSMFGGEPDSYGDVIVSGAYTETLSKGGRNGNGVAMLWQHDPTKPLGVWTNIEENAKGLKVEGQLAMNTQLGKEAYELMKMGALRGLSIGYEINKDGFEVDEKKKIRRLKSINLWEISPVTFPASTRAQITGVKAAIEGAKNDRELEKALHEAGLSISASKYIVSLCRSTLVGRMKPSDKVLLDALRDVRSEINSISLKSELAAFREMIQNFKSKGE